MIVGVMSQPLRTKYAAAYLGAATEPTTLITVAAADFGNSPLASNVRIVLVDQPRSAPSAMDRLTRTGIARRLLRWARSGSRQGRRVERLLRRMLWRARRARAAQSPAPHRANSAVVDAIRSVVSDHDVTQIMCFDLFDLVAVEEALHTVDRATIPVVVR